MRTVSTIAASAKRRVRAVACAPLLRPRARIRPGRFSSARRQAAAHRDKSGSEDVPRSAASSRHPPPPPAARDRSRPSRDHVPNEILVPGNIDHADGKHFRLVRRSSSRWAKPRSIVMPRAFSSGNRSGSTAGERFDQRALAVIDVAGGGENEMLRRHIAVRSLTQTFEWRERPASSCDGKIVRRSSLERALARRSR